MADHERPDPDADDPFLERRLTSLAVLPVPPRPSVDELVRRGGATELDAEPERAVGGGGHRSRRSWLVAGAAAAVLLVVAAVGGIVRQGDAELASGTGSDLAGRIFWSQSVTEAGVPRTIPTGTPGELPVSVVLIFDADGQTLRASQGCDELEARYTIDGDRLVVAPPTVNDRPCSPEVETQEAWLRTFLTSTPTISLDGDRLTLTSGPTVVELLDREVAEVDLPLSGTAWSLETITEDGVATDARALLGSIVFEARADGITVDFAGFDGCKRFTGSLRWEGDDITMVEWSPQNGTPCANVEHEDAFATTLRPGLVIEITGSRLTITKGTLGLAFRGTPEAPDLTDLIPDVPVPDPADPSDPNITVDPSDPSVAPVTWLEGASAIAALPGVRWELQSVVVGGVVTSATPAGTAPRAYLTFVVEALDPTWAVEAVDGCNGGGGRAAATATAISFGGMGWEEMGCPGIDDGVVATTVHTVLSGESTYETDGETLIIHNGDGALVLRSSGSAAGSTSPPTSAPASGP